MITIQDKINIVNDRMISLSSRYDELDFIIRERNDGQPGSKEWCLVAKIDLGDILLMYDALSKEMDLLVQQYNAGIVQ